MFDANSCHKLIFALLFHLRVEALMGSTNDPENGDAVAATCLWAAVVYSVSVGGV